MTVAWAILALVVVNLWTFLCFGLDKAYAESGRRRLSESSLLTLALIGGSPAALLARRHFRHKTRKQPFSTILMVIAALHVGLLAGLLLFVV